MIERPFDYDPSSGLRTTYLEDPTTGEIALRYEQDVEPVLDDNKAAESAWSRTARMPDMVHVASIPPSVQLKWLVEKGVNIFNPDHKQAMGRLLDDPEWKHLKRVPLTLGRLR